MKTPLPTPAAHAAAVRKESETEYARFLSSLGLTFSATFAGQVTREDWPCYAWQVTISREKRTISRPYHMGLGHAVRPPSPLPIRPMAPRLPGVIYSFIQEAACASGTFEDFCADLGLSTDSRKALETYLDCQSIGHAVRALLGPDFDKAAALSADF